MAMAKTENASMAVSRADPRSYITSPFIKIVVGPARKLYLAHKALLVQYSPYFEACLNPRFDEGTRLRVDLSHANSYAFDGFISWLYNGNLRNMNLVTFDSCNDCIKLYQLADTLLTPDFANVVMDDLRFALRKLHTTPFPSHIIQLHEMGLLNSRLGRFCIRSVVWSISTKASIWVTGNSKDEGDMMRYRELNALYEQQEIAVEVFKYMVEFGNNKWVNPAFSDNCDYHEHLDGSRCPSSLPDSWGLHHSVANRGRVKIDNDEKSVDFGVDAGSSRRPWPWSVMT